MLPGNVHNFGHELPSLRRVDAPERGDTPKARLRIERKARPAAAARDGVDSVVLRAGDFFGGPGSGTRFDMALVKKLGRGRLVYPGEPTVARAWAYLPDLAQAFVRVAAQRARLHGHHRLHFAGHAPTGEALRSAMELLFGRRLRIAGLPWPLIRIASPFVPTWRELLTMRYLRQRPHALDHAELRGL